MEKWIFRMRLACVVSCVLGGVLATLLPVRVEAQIPSCQIRVDELIDRVGVVRMPYGGTDKGIGNTGLRLTPMGRRNIAGAPFTIWRIRNSGSATTVGITTDVANLNLNSFPLPAHTDAYFRSESAAASATHNLTVTNLTQTITLDTQVATNTAWSDTTLVADPVCTEPTVSLWIAHSKGLTRVSTIDLTTLLIDLPVVGGVETIAVDTPQANAWTYSNGKLRAFSPTGSPLIDVPTVSHGLFVPATLAVDGNAGDVWLGLGNVLYRLAFDGSVVGQLTMAGTIRNIELDPMNGRVWVGGAGGFSIVRAGEFPERPIVRFLANATLATAHSIVRDSSTNGFWVGTPAAINRYDANGVLVISGANSRAAARSLADDGNGGVWATVKDSSIYHFTRNGAQQWVQTPPPPNTDVAQLASDPVTHRVWTLAGSRLRAFGLTKPSSGPFGPGTEVPRPGVTQTRTYYKLATFTDRAAPIVQFVAPAAGAYTNNRKPSLQVAYGDQATTVNPASLSFKLGNAALAVTCSVRTATKATCTPQTDLPEGALDISATLSDSNGNQSLPVHRYFTVDVTAPSITVTRPVNGGYTNQKLGPVEGQLNESGTVVIGSSTVSTDAFNHFTAPVTLNEGTNSRTIIATDRATNRTQLPYSVNLDTQVPPAADNSKITVGAPGNGSVVVTGLATSVEASSTVRVTNLRTNAVVTANATATGAFTVTIEAQAGDALRVVVEDHATNSSLPLNLTVAGAGNSGLIVTVNAPATGTSVNSPTATVSGVVAGVIDASVTINGFSAQTFISGADTAFSDVVSLVAGVNTIEIVATRPGGATGRAQIQLTYVVPNPYRVDASPTTAVAPINVEFRVLQFIADDTFVATFDFDGNGTVDQTIDTLGAPVSHLYSSAGSVTAHVKVKGSSNVTYSFDLPISVVTPEQVDAQIRPAWDGLISALRAGNTTSALTFISTTAASRYAATFQQMQSALPDIANGLSHAELRFAGADYADYVVSRLVGTEQRVFVIQFVRDPDGVWRVAEM